MRTAAVRQKAPQDTFVANIVPLRVAGTRDAALSTGNLEAALQGLRGFDDDAEPLSVQKAVADALHDTALARVAQEKLEALKKKGATFAPPALEVTASPFKDGPWIRADVSVSSGKPVPLPPPGGTSTIWTRLPETSWGGLVVARSAAEVARAPEVTMDRCKPPPPIRQRCECVFQKDWDPPEPSPEVETVEEPRKSRPARTRSASTTEDCTSKCIHTD